VAAPCLRIALAAASSLSATAPRAAAPCCCAAGTFSAEKWVDFQLGYLTSLWYFKDLYFEKKVQFFLGGSRPPHSWLSHLRHGTASNMHKLGAKLILKHHYLVGG